MPASRSPAPDARAVICPLCGAPEVELVSGRLVRHGRRERPAQKCPASGLFPADVA